MPLERYVGENGMASLLAFIHAGQVDSSDRGPWFSSPEEFTELLRRLTIPHYEEARRYWGKATADGEFDGANEVSPYQQRTLKRIIETYSQQESEA